jgi:hypothetical protein
MEPLESSQAKQSNRIGPSAIAADRAEGLKASAKGRSTLSTFWSRVFRVSSTSRTSSRPEHPNT